ncbi:hypothetical protein SAMN05192574_102212 [Mucilaginibacter gossypiicola]|uniref:Uncharacterized protein n=1 Tax=Mucilaginibacter gossypiicola TaxID=551995 RepID=A0A1H8D4Y3_9SPHI|nr:hypothetical protein [Mucilaginibacter gossypiicola]SEN02381.1 hypothetical protein SAMN05192574_102212 [Mucilaginibacter gossypiicola]
MIDYLTKLGVPPIIQEFFAAEEPFFDFGDQQEHFSEAIHRVPATRNLWTAGNQFARQVIITFSALEAVAFLTLNQANYQNFNELLFIATGARISDRQLKWVRLNLKGREFTLAFGNELIGRITDIKVAATIRNKPVRLYVQAGKVIARLKEQTAVFEEEKLSLYAFETRLGIRTMIRTCKPLNQLTFLDQLKYDSSR